MLPASFTKIQIRRKMSSAFSKLTSNSVQIDLNFQNISILLKPYDHQRTNLKTSDFYFHPTSNNNHNKIVNFRVANYQV
jgi:hypothetical protein